MTEKEMQSLGDKLKELIHKRTGLTPEQLQCPREKSDMTPCVARDGGIVVTSNSFGNPLCVGCEARVDRLVAKEVARR